MLVVCCLLLVACCLSFGRIREVVRLAFFGSPTCHFSRGAIRDGRAKTHMEFVISFGRAKTRMEFVISFGKLGEVVRFAFFLGPPSAIFRGGATRVGRAKTRMECYIFIILFIMFTIVYIYACTNACKPANM